MVIDAFKPRCVNRFDMANVKALRARGRTSFVISEPVCKRYYINSDSAMGYGTATTLRAWICPSDGNRFVTCLSRKSKKGPRERPTCIARQGRNSSLDPVAQMRRAPGVPLSTANEASV